MQTNTRRLTIIALLGALTIIMGMTPLGFIPIPGFAAKVTIMHVPVIIGALMEGPVVGLAIGAIFGAFSMLQAVIAPTSPLSLMFLNPMIAFLPRMAIALAASAMNRLLRRWRAGGSRISHVVSYASSAVAGALVNTVGVLGLMYLLYIQDTAAALDTTPELVGAVLLGVAATNGVPEAIAGAVIVTAVMLALHHRKKKKPLPTA